MELIKTSLLTAISTSARILFGFLANKIIAIYAGPSGLALIGQLRSLIAMATTIGTGAIHVGVIRYTAEHRHNEVAKAKLFSTALRISLGATLLVALALVIFDQQLSRLLLKTTSHAAIFVILAITLVSGVFTSLLLAITNGHKEIKTFVAINIVSGLVGFITLWLMTPWWGLKGALYACVIYQPFVFVLALMLTMKCQWFKLRLFTKKIHKKYLIRLGKDSMMAITTALITPTCLMIVRNHIGESVSWSAAGHWHGIWKISEAYLMVVTTTLSVYYLPRLAELKGRVALKTEIITCYKIVMPFVVVSALIIFVLRRQIINVLFTPAFQPMQVLFAFQLIGDVIKIASWLLAYVIIAKAMTRVFIYTELFFGATFVGLSFILLKINGVVGVTQAFALNYLFYFITVAVILRKRVW